ncbi:hypothetical protein GCM10027299_00980 [Larkinella ripae]
MKNKVNIFWLLVTAFILCSCGRTKVLVATFENDSVGAEPNTTLPGDPVGDMIRYDRSMAPRIRVQNSVIAGDKALHISQIPISGQPTRHTGWVEFIGIPITSDRKLLFSWAAQYHNTGFLEEFVQTDITNGAGIVLVRLYFYGNDSVKNVSDISTDEGRVSRPINLKKEHSVFVEIDLRTKTYNLNIITADSTVNLPNQPLATIGGTRPPYAVPFNPKVAFQLDQGQSENRKYILEGVDISQEK